MNHTTTAPATAERSLDDLTIREYADRRGVTSRTVRRWGAEGHVTLYRVGPKLLYVASTADNL